MKTNQLFIDTSTRTLEELERAAYLAGDIQAAELYAIANDPPVSARVAELTADLKEADEIIEDLRQENDALKRFAYQVADLNIDDRVEILRLIQRAEVLI
jgi:CO dehydrogenase nickel-insertion accessory protein CooC1